LTLNQNLVNASKWLSQDMANKNYFNHTDSQGRTFDKRLVDFGYTPYATIGENIAAGSETGAAAMTQWQNSPPHNANMLSSAYKNIGIGRAYNANSTYKWYWTTDFGTMQGG
jgi:uncharacterized protein YkwD